MSDISLPSHSGGAALDTNILKFLKFIHSIFSTIYTSKSLAVTIATLKRIETWIRSITSDDRLWGLCMMSVHRKINVDSKDSFFDTDASVSTRIQTIETVRLFIRIR